MMPDWVKAFSGKKIHIVGVTGSEGSSILRLFSKYPVSDLTVHDYVRTDQMEKNFRLWHKGISVAEKTSQYELFLQDISCSRVRFGQDYLSDIGSADVIFVPQSWRLYPDRNHPLTKVAGRIPFYSLTRLYLDYAPCRVCAVTGTVGKGSVCFLLEQVLTGLGIRAHRTGNDTWNRQMVDRMDEMRPEDLLILEVSHRQLADGFTRAPEIAVCTNLFPNHLTEVSWKEYLRLKATLFTFQKPGQTSVLNYDSEDLVSLSKKLQSSISFFSIKYPNMNTKNIQEYFFHIMKIKSTHYISNILAVCTISDILGIKIPRILDLIPKMQSLPARIQSLGVFQSREIFDDIKSTTPWATIAALEKLNPQVVIVGGDPKGISYDRFLTALHHSKVHVVSVSSPLSSLLSHGLHSDRYTECKDLKTALDAAFVHTRPGDRILISPSAAFFYRDVIRGKQSIRKLLFSREAKQS